MIEEIRNIKSGKRELKQFGLTLGIILGLLGGLFFLRHKGYYPYFLLASFAFLSFGLIAPGVLKPIQKAWMSLAVIIGWFVTRVILTVLFYFVVTPVGILAKVFNKDLLDIKFNRDRDSYWIARESIDFDKKSYENQF